MNKYEKYKTIKNLPVPTIEALDLLFGSKPVLYGTLTVSNNSELKSVKNRFESLGLIIKFQGDFNSLDNVTENNNNEIRLNFALSEEETLATDFLQYESNNEHQTMGKLLGYPECCSKCFNNYFPDQNSEWTGKKIANYFIERLKNFKIYHFYTNRLLRFSEYCSLLYHFPCELDCKESIEIAERRYNILNQVDSSKADKMKNNLSSVILFEIDKDADGFYEEVTNVVYIPDYEYNNMEINVNGDVFKGSEYTNNEFYKNMRSINNINIKSNNRYLIDDKIVDRDNFRIVAFE